MSNTKLVEIILNNMSKIKIKDNKNIFKVDFEIILNKKDLDYKKLKKFLEESQIVSSGDIKDE